jgi:hypothetical protein
MKTVILQQPRLIVLLLLAGTVGLLLLMLVTSDPSQRCEGDQGISLLKLI